MNRVETEVVYEDVLADLLDELRVNIMNRRDNYVMPDDGLAAVRARVAWMGATQKDLLATQQLTILSSGDDTAARASLRWRLRASYLDMAAWIVHERLRDEFLFAVTRKEIADRKARELQAVVDEAAERAEQSGLFEDAPAGPGPFRVSADGVSKSNDGRAEGTP